MNHKLFDQLTQANATDEEIEELYRDLQFVFDNPFDTEITLALNRNCAYIEQTQPVAH